MREVIGSETKLYIVSSALIIYKKIVRSKRKNSGVKRIKITLTKEEKEFYLLHGEEIFKLTQKNRKVMRYQFDNWDQIREFRKKNKYYGK